MAAHWYWELCGPTGIVLGELTTATGRTLNFARNAAGRASCVIAHEDDTANLLMTALSTGVPTIKAWRKADGDTTATLRFNGYLAAIDESLEETGTLTLDFRGPFSRLVGEGAQRGRYTGSYASAAAVDAGAIANSLVKLYGGRSDGVTGGSDTSLTNAAGALTYQETSYVGLDIGTTETTRTRSPIYQYSNAGDAIVSLSNMLDGFDFMERYVDGGSTYAYLDIFAQQGSDRTGAKFEYGPKTMRNVSAVSRASEPPINNVVLLGAYGLVSNQSNAASVTKYGRWYSQASRPDVYDQGSLDALALGLLRPDWVKTLQCTPDPTLAPAPWDDYWIGDTVHFYGRRGSFTQDSALRVNAIDVVIDDNGHEAASIPDPLDPEGERILQAGLATEIV